MDYKANPDKVYDNLHANIRFTDEISFKLLAFVPLISGAAIAISFLKAEIRSIQAICFISLYGSAITLGLFWWELRNIKTCNYLLTCLAFFDNTIHNKENNPPPKPLKIRKAGAEKFIYSVTILSWLLFPYALTCSFEGASSHEVTIPYFHMAFGILLFMLTDLSVFANVSSKPPILKKR